MLRTYSKYIEMISSIRVGWVCHAIMPQHAKSKSKNGHHEQVRHRDVVEQQWFTRVKCQTGYCGQIKSQDLDG